MFKDNSNGNGWEKQRIFNLLNKQQNVKDNDELGKRCEKNTAKLPVNRGSLRTKWYKKLDINYWLMFILCTFSV